VPLDSTLKDSFAHGLKFLGGENGLESWEDFAAIVNLQPGSRGNKPGNFSQILNSSRERLTFVEKRQYKLFFNANLFKR
jgi:hypothetical protein